MNLQKTEFEFVRDNSREPNTVMQKSSIRRRLRPSVLWGVLAGLAALAGPLEARAICGLDGAVYEQLRTVKDPQVLQTLSLKIHRYGTCSACHLARFGGPRNEFGAAVNTLLTLRDREDPVRQREVGRRLLDVSADPSLPDSPTFGQRLQQGRLPGSSLANREPPATDVPASVTASGPESVLESVTVEQARALVTKARAESKFGILQLSRVRELSPEAARELAEFRGDTLMLGIRTLAPETAVELAKSRAANVWLHGVTSVSPETAEALVKLRGHLVMTGLTELDSVPLAEKLADRPGALSLPWLKSITPEVARALGKNRQSLTLAGLTRISPEAQAQLTQTVGALSLPGLRSIDSSPLAKKLAASAVLLPNVERLTREQFEQFVGVRGQESFFGGIYLPIAAITPEIAAAAAAIPRAINLILTGDEVVSDEVLKTLLSSRWNVALQDVEQLTAGQLRILNEGLEGTTFRAGVFQSPRLSLPKLRKLDSAILADLLARTSGFSFPSVKEISPDAAAALGALPDAEFKRQDGTVETRPSGDLNLLSLEELSPETARLLLRKRWQSISLPSLQEVSLETVGLLARQTRGLNLGIPALPPEFAEAFSQAPSDASLGDGYFMFPNVNDLSPEAARLLVKSLNRGYRDLGTVRISNSPKLYFGGDFGLPSRGFPTLSPELAAELAKYEGILAIQGLGELPDESAAALASFPGPYLILFGPGADALSPAASASLAKVPGVLQIQLRRLDSVPLAERFARQINFTLYNLETVSDEAAPALSGYRQFFDLRALTVLESPVMARRFIEGTTGGGSVTLPALSTLSPEAAEILAAGSKPLYLGLTTLDSPAVARALAKAKAQSRLQLPRLRAATPEVIEILELPKSDIYVLTDDPAR